jgi:hypothetical protein
MSMTIIHDFSYSLRFALKELYMLYQVLWWVAYMSDILAYGVYNGLQDNKMMWLSLISKLRPETKEIESGMVHLVTKFRQTGKDRISRSGLPAAEAMCHSRFRDSYRYSSL